VIHTRLCDLLGIDHPLLNAPMGGTAAADLAAAVSAAGAFGMIGGTSCGGADWLRAQVRGVRARTDRPFGVGFIASFPGTDDLVQVALDERVRIFAHVAVVARRRRRLAGEAVRRQPRVSDKDLTVAHRAVDGHLLMWAQ
jgi:NAD(P)H-dependent flavin oxidoreductase YrpB (nitropropane dioxygenase family)